MTVCRDKQSACDGVEYCNGASMVCPADLMAPRGTLCRPATGGCDAEETCSGMSFECGAIF